MNQVVAAHETLECPLKSTQGLKCPPCPPPPIPLRITDKLSKEQTTMVGNARTPMKIHNEHFEGSVFFKLKTNPEDPYFAPYFGDKKRMFEIQAQGRLLNVSDDQDVYIGIETPRQLNLGMWGRFASTIILKLLHALTHGAHANAGSDKDRETAHIALPLNTAADRLIITKPGEEPPALGVEQLPELMSKEERHAITKYDPQDTYTMSFHSMYINWCTWELVNVPGLPPVSLKLLFDDQPVRFVGYTVSKDLKHEPHSDDIKSYLFCIEFQSLLG